MIELFSTEFWIAMLFLVIFFLVVFLFMIVKRLNRIEFRVLEYEDQYGTLADQTQGSGRAQGAASDIIGMLEPLVKESRQAAISFDEQIREKKRLLRELNKALDDRIISINLLLSRADALQKKMEKRQSQAVPTNPFVGFSSPELTSERVLDQQNRILELFQDNHDAKAIAKQLAIPRGEVELVIDLKKRFLAMEESS